MAEEADRLVGRWVHAHEEDDAGHRVFRRAGTALPPSRGRTVYEIAADLTARRVGPGPDDRPIMAGGGELRVALGGGDADLRVTEVTEERLVIER